MGKKVDPEVVRLRAKLKRLRGLMKGKSRTTVVLHYIHPEGNPRLTYEGKHDAWRNENR